MPHDISKEVKTLRIAPFTLNGASLLKKKIKLMDNPYQIEVKDQGKQCTINMSTTTYHIIMNNIVPIGERVGLKMVKPLDVDSSGKALKSQYECQLLVTEAVTASITISCYHTTNNILVQLKGKKISEDVWEKKLEAVHQFAHVTMKSVIMWVEQTDNYMAIKEKIREALREMQENGFSEGTLRNFEDNLIPTIEASDLMPATKSDQVMPKSCSITGADQSLQLGEIRGPAPSKTDENCPKTSENGTSTPVTPQCPSPEPALSSSNTTVSTPERAGDKPEIVFQKENEDIVNEPENADVMSPVLKKPSPFKSPSKKCSKGCSPLRVQSLEKEKIELSQTVETLQTHQETLRSTIESKNDLLQTQTKLVSDQQEKINKQKQQIEELKISSATHNQFADSFLDCLVAAEEGNEVLLMENEKNVKQQLYKKISEKDEEVTTLSKEKVDLQNEIQKLTATLSEKTLIEEKYNAATKKLQSKTKENAALVTQLSTVEATVVSRKKDLNAAETKLVDVENENVSLKHELDLLRKNLTESESCNEKLREDLDNELKKSLENPEIHQLCTQLSTQVQEKDEEILNLQESHAYSEKSIEELKCKVQESEDLVVFIQRQVKEESALRLKYQEELCAVKVENQMLQKNVATVTEQLQRNRSLAGLETLGEDKKESVDEKKSLAEEKEDHSLLPCIFEVKEKGRCNRGEKCKFKHDFDPKLRGDTEAIKLLLDDTSKSSNRCAREMVNGKCIDMDNCPYPHRSQNLSAVSRGRRVCFRELVEKHSCKRKTGKCKFSHIISDEQRNDPSFVNQMIKEKEEKASKCINEFEAEGRCHKGSKCPFSHAISDEDRKNPELRKRIAVTKNSVTGKSGGDEKSSNKGGSVENEDLKGILIALMADVKVLKEKQGCP